MGTKQSGLEHILGDFARSTGSLRGPSAPRPFQRTGGPLMGAAVRSLLLGGLGYAGGRLASPLYSNKLDPHRVGMFSGGLGALLGGVLPSLPFMLHNLSQSRKAGTPVNLRNFFQTLNQPGWETPGSTKAGGYDDEDPMGIFTEPGEHFNPYEPSSFDSQSIPVGRMADLVSRSGVNRDTGYPVINALYGAAGGRDRGLVSPRQVMDAGMRLGVGYLIGRPAMSIVSKTLGAVANLPSPSQEKLTRYGTLAMMLGNAFGGRR